MATGKLETNSKIGKWKLGRLLGSGGQGQVWEARPATGAHSPARALKVCFHTEAQARARFAQEIELLRGLPTNTWVIPLLDSNLDWEVEAKSGLACAFYVTERFDSSLEKLHWIHRAPLYALEIFREVCIAVRFLHELPAAVLH